MIRHQHKRMNAPAKQTLRSGKQIEEAVPVLVGEIGIPPFDAAIVDMPESTGVLEAKRSWQEFAAEETKEEP